jgi:hypothetical protein
MGRLFPRIEPKKINTMQGEKIASKELLKVILPCLKVLGRRLNNNFPNMFCPYNIGLAKNKPPISSN